MPTPTPLLPAASVPWSITTSPGSFAAARKSADRWAPLDEDADEAPHRDLTADLVAPGVAPGDVVWTKTADELITKITRK